MRFLVREFKSVSGESVAVLVNDQGSPFFWTNVFAVSDYRNTGKSPRTISKVLRTLAMAHTWAESHELDLDKALSVGELITVEQAESLAHFLRLNACNQQMAVSKTRNPVVMDKIVSLERLQGYRKSEKSKVVAVSAFEAATRIRWVIKYIKWHMERRLGSLDRARKDSTLIKEVGNIVVSRLEALTPKVRQTSVDEERLEGISDEACAIAEDLFRPGSESNPFTPGFHQERNYLIWRFLYETGMRREELQSILVEKVDYSQRRVQITKSKTLKRTVPISELLALKFHDFILNHWSKISPRLRKHGFLFTTEKGGHIGLNTINLIFRTARNSNDDLPDFLAPHVMRRTWNDRFLELGDIQQERSGRSIDGQAIQNRLQGWRDNSNMRERYGKRVIRKKADKIAEKLANELTEKNSEKH